MGNAERYKSKCYCIQIKYTNGTWISFSRIHSTEQCAISDHLLSGAQGNRPEYLLRLGAGVSRPIVLSCRSCGTCGQC